MSEASRYATIVHESLVMGEKLHALLVPPGNLLEDARLEAIQIDADWRNRPHLAHVFPEDDRPILLEHALLEGIRAEGRPFCRRLAIRSSDPDLHRLLAGRLAITETCLANTRILLRDADGGRLQLKLVMLRAGLAAPAWLGWRWNETPFVFQPLDPRDPSAHDLLRTAWQDSEEALTDVLVRPLPPAEEEPES